MLIPNPDVSDNRRLLETPTHSAVQIAAAMTACARIYMHPSIHRTDRKDGDYQDTDSVVPLPASRALRPSSPRRHLQPHYRARVKGAVPGTTMLPTQRQNLVDQGQKRDHGRVDE